MGYGVGTRLPPGGVVDGGAKVSQAFGCTWFQAEWPCGGLGCAPGQMWHAGIDLVAPYGTLLRSVGYGQVIQIGRGGPGCGGLGPAAVGIRSGLVDIWYGHCSQALVAQGQLVTPGMAIARMGYRGCVWPPGFAGTHLHFEVLPAGEWNGCRALAPEPYLSRWGPAPTPTGGAALIVLAGAGMILFGLQRHEPNA